MSADSRSKSPNKSLFLIRHAQTQNAEGNMTDRERPLTLNGKADARALGLYMSRHYYQPDFILCSPAVRTRQTLDGIDNSLRTVRIEYAEKLYNATRGDLLAFIQNTADTINALMIVAHNPGIYELAAMLAQEKSASLMNRLGSGFKPGAFAVLQYPGMHWQDIKPAENPLIDFSDPQDYNAPASPARWT